MTIFVVNGARIAATIHHSVGEAAAALKAVFKAVFSSASGQSSQSGNQATVPVGIVARTALSYCSRGWSSI